MTGLMITNIVLALAVLGLVLALLARGRSGSVDQRLDLLQRGQERTESVLREEAAVARREAGEQAQAQRQEITQAIRSWGDSALNAVARLGEQQAQHLQAIVSELRELSQANERRMAELRETVDTRLKDLQEDNAAKLEQMRQTVDERLSATLEQRLGESFRQVSERLEAVHRGLGEMQSLAAGVGDLKQVLTNVKTRGTWGEVQLGMLLEQILAPDQYQKNVVCKLGSEQQVEYAIRLPGAEGDKDGGVWLPIDAKFPVEDYQRMLDAEEKGDVQAREDALKNLESRVRQEARDIQAKYLDPPRTTDFGIMFLPTEGLYAEVLRRPGLAESLQRDFRVVVTGPTTLAALLNSLQMGFRTLAVERRSSEVWQLLGAVKTQFGHFGALLERVHKRLDQASTTIEDAAKKSRTIERRLRAVEEIPPEAAADMLGLTVAEDAVELTASGDDDA